MQHMDTSEIIRRFNQAFEEHDPSILEDLVAPDCVMESIQPAPDGTRYEGYDVNLAFWQAMAADRVNRFEVEETVVMGERDDVVDHLFQVVVRGRRARFVDHRALLPKVLGALGRPARCSFLRLPGIGLDGLSSVE